MNREAVFEQLKIDEGVVYEIYNDHLGYPTFGVGHLVLDSDPEFGEPVGTKVSEERVRSCFDRDLETAIGECHALYGEREFGDFPDEVQQILVNMMFNMGTYSSISKFKKTEHAALSGWSLETSLQSEGRDSLWHTVK